MGERTLLLGYDLCDTRTQLAVYNRERMEPELIGQTDENPDAIYDTAISLEGKEPIRDFLGKIRRGEDIVVEGKVSNPVNVLAYYFRKTLSATRRQFPSETIKQLVVTVPDQSAEYVKLIYDALEKLNIGRDRAAVISHKQSFLYYTLYQKKELWVNDVGLFDYEGKKLRYYQMKLDRRKNPVLAGAVERDLSDAISVAEESGQRKDMVFENIVQGVIHKQILSTLYMTGNGFDGDWSDDVLKRLCVGRRLFRGGNLYVSGACYAARELGESAKLENYMLLDEDMIHCHIILPVYKDAKEQEYLLARAGMPWYQVDKTVDVIPDNENEISFQIKNIFTNEEKSFMIDLNPVAGKTDRRCRLSVRIRFADVKTCVLTIKDRGFGEIFPTSNRIWEKTLTID